MSQLSRWIEVTFVLVLVYLVLTNYKGFASAVSSLGSVYSSSVKVLQGR
jgi:hypothetical protein